MQLIIRQNAFPFIVGCGRSGTTLLRAMLNAHPEFAIPGESYFPIWLSRFPSPYRHWDEHSGERFVDQLLSDKFFTLWHLPPEKVRSAIEDTRPRDFAEAVRTVFSLYAHEKGKSRYGDKTPLFVGHVKSLRRLFDEAVFIHIIRDGRDVALSVAEASFGPTRFDQAALHWKVQVGKGLRAAKFLGPQRFQSLRYEDLVAKPESELTRLCDFLAVPYSDTMLDYPAQATSLLSELPNPEEHQGIGTAPATRRDWRQKLSAEDRAVFQILAGDVLDAAGYEPCGERPSRAALIRAGKARMEWERRQVWRHGRSYASRGRDAVAPSRVR